MGFPPFLKRSLPASYALLKKRCVFKSLKKFLKMESPDSMNDRDRLSFRLQFIRDCRHFMFCNMRFAQEMLPSVMGVLTSSQVSFFAQCPTSCKSNF